MNQIVASVILTTGTTYLIRYSMDYFAYAIVNKSSELAADSVKKVWKSMTKKDNEIIEYELIDMDREDPDQIIYVTSNIVNKEWDTIDSELTDIYKKEEERKKMTPKFGPSKRIPRTPLNGPSSTPKRKPTLDEMPKQIKEEYMTQLEL